MQRIQSQYLVAGLMVMAALGGCAGMLAGRSASDVRAAIEEGNRAFSDAIRAGDSARLAAYYTEDAIAFPPDAPMVRGRAAIGQMWQQAITAGGLKAAALRTVDVEVTGDTAHEAGEATLRMEPRGGSATDAAIKYVVVWKRVGGRWLVHRDIWNAMPAR